MRVASVILAAGKGTRMKSNLPKVLHKICGRPMIDYVLKAVKEAGVEKIITVVGHQGELVARAINDRAEVVYQEPQLGTAHALLQAGKILADFSGYIIVVSGDTPLITGNTLKSFLGEHQNSKAIASIITTCLKNPQGYGRVVRDESGRVVKIVEHKDAGPGELNIKEVNTGVYCFNLDGLFENLANIKANNVQGEYYLTDLIQKYVMENKPVSAYRLKDHTEVLGINDRCQLAEVEALMRKRVLEELMFSGVTVVDPSSTFIDQGVVIGQDSIIYPFTIIEGKSIIGPNSIIGPGTRLVNVQLGKEVSVVNSVVLESIIEDFCNIGPFTYIRPGCKIESGVKIGDFVELKKAKIGEKSKVPHLSYIGDATIGSGVNVGAGTITCNYDGAKKWPTYIGNDAFIGSNTNLVAPVEVGEKAVIAAGSTITKNVPPGALGVARGHQRNVENWVERKNRLIKKEGEV